MGHIVGVDGGGTKTVAVLADLEGNVLGRGMAGPSNYHSVGVEAAAQAIQAAVLEAAGDRLVHAAYLGLAGVDRPEDARTLESALDLPANIEQVVVDNDAVIALATATLGNPGVVIIAGTGCIAYGEDSSGRRARASGWGTLLGDEGSGYDIGRRAMVAALRATDGRGPATKLVSLITDHFGIRDITKLVDLVYVEKLSPDSIAAVTPVVVQAAAAGDETSRLILEDAGRELGLAGVSVIKRLNMGGEILVGLLGGVFNCGPLLIRPLENCIHTCAPRAQVEQAAADPVLGAVIKAKALHAGCPPAKSFVDRILKTYR